jgi:hypothetical protein
MKSGVVSRTAIGATEIERLLRERQDLISSGTYTVDDPLIQELDR